MSTGLPPAGPLEAVSGGTQEGLEASAAPPRSLDGVAIIAAERKRQIEKEGWTPAHDEEHDAGELARAAATYAMPAARRHFEWPHKSPTTWPWAHEWWKPSPDRIRELAKAGALIAAEIDRLQRASGNATPKEAPPASPACPRCGLPAFTAGPCVPSPDSPSQGERKQQLLGGPAAQAERPPGDTLGEVYLLRYWLLRAYKARQREGWEEGPTEAETFDRVLDVLCNIGLDPTKLHGAADAVLAGPEWCIPGPATREPAAGPPSPSSASLESGGGTLDTMGAVTRDTTTPEGR